MIYFNTKKALPLILLVLFMLILPTSTAYSQDTTAYKKCFTMEQLQAIAIDLKKLEYCQKESATKDTIITNCEKIDVTKQTEIKKLKQNNWKKTGAIGIICLILGFLFS